MEGKSFEENVTTSDPQVHLREMLHLTNLKLNLEPKTNSNAKVNAIKQSFKQKLYRTKKRRVCF